MRANHVACLALVLAASLLGAADPAPSPIRLPSGPVAPLPAPAPSGATSLAFDQWYVIDASVECTVIVSPDGLVKVAESAGPVSLRGKFVDGTGDVETRTYKGPFVYDLQPAKNAAGNVEVIVTPVGGKSKDVIRRTLNLGPLNPIPPPKPKPSPDPADPVVTPTALWGFVVIEETADAVAKRGAFLSDTALSSLMKAKGYQWRMVDKDVVGADGKPPADVLPMLKASAGKGYPQLFIVDKSGNVVSQSALGDAASVVALLKKWGQ